MSISVEAFLWHPHSIKYSVQDSKYAYNDQLLADMDDQCDEEVSHSSNSDSHRDENSSLKVSLPPRMILEQKDNSSCPSYDMQDVAEKWAKRRRYRIIAFGHVIACTRTKRLMFIDFIMERMRDAAVVLACVYYSPCRGGEALHIAREYMREIQTVCNQQMEFFPRVLALCIYDSSELLQAASAFSFDSATASVFSSHGRKRKSPHSSSSPTSTKRRVQQHPRKMIPKVYAMDVTTSSSAIRTASSREAVLPTPSSPEMDSRSSFS
jgi:hypothetical protein